MPTQRECIPLGRRAPYCRPVPGPWSLEEKVAEEFRRGLAVVVRRENICARVEQRVHDGGVPQPRRPVQRGARCLVTG